MAPEGTAARARIIWEKITITFDQKNSTHEYSSLGNKVPKKSPKITWQTQGLLKVIHHCTVQAAIE